MIELNRKCLKCNTDFVLKSTAKASNICYKCKREYQRAYARKKVEETPEEARYKDNYPIEENKRREIWKKRAKMLEKMKSREEWQTYFKERLDYMEEHEKEILIWIYDRRDNESREQERDRRITKSEYEDTRTTSQNKSWFD
jgi:hypothetical protein